jgi:hypothetical protein
MKKLIVVIVCLTICLTAKSQTFEKIVDSSKTWNILIGDYLVNSYATYQIKFQGDTIINLKNYKKIWRAYGDSIFFPYGSIREDTAGKIFRIDGLDTAEYLLYDFNVQVGDTIFLHDDFGSLTTAIVDSIDTEFIANKNRKVIYTSFWNGNFTDYWIEGIGSMMGVLYPGNVVMDFGSQLLCYWKDSIKLLTTDAGINYGCNFTNTGISDYSSVETIQVYPTITHDFIKIDVGNLDFLEIKILNIMGIEMKSITLDHSLTTINLIGLPSGMYIYEILNKSDLKVKEGKIIKI